MAERVMENSTRLRREVLKDSILVVSLPPLIKVYKVMQQISLLQCTTGIDKFVIVIGER